MNLEELKLHRDQARQEVIATKKIVDKDVQIYYRSKSAYEKAVADYQRLDKEYALAQLPSRTEKTKAKKAYNANKRTAEKAMKQLKSLPKELRDKIIAEMKDELF